jgi:general stress protein YciG
MAGTKAGAALAKKTNLERHGKNFFAQIGQKGGTVKGVKKGFAANPALAAKAGQVGGTRSRRGKKTV